MGRRHIVTEKGGNEMMRNSRNSYWQIKIEVNKERDRRNEM